MVETRRVQSEQAQQAAQSQPRGADGQVDLLGDIARRVRLPSGVTAAAALEAVMCTLSQHTAGREARHVIDALPKEIRPVLDRCAEHRDRTVSPFNRSELLHRISEHLHVSPGDAEDIASAVLMAIGSRLAPEEVHSIAERLPLELRDLWAVRRAAPPVEPHPILTQIEREVALPYGVTGVGAFTAAMGTLTLRLSKGEARHVLGALPPDLRPLLEPFVRDRDEAGEKLDAAHLVSRVAVLLNMDDPEALVRAVFAATQEYLRSDVLEHVMSQLPRDLQDLWMLPTLP